jgi:hypothetical protein
MLSLRKIEQMRLKGEQNNAFHHSTFYFWIFSNMYVSLLRVRYFGKEKSTQEVFEKIQGDRPCSYRYKRLFLSMGLL